MHLVDANGIRLHALTLGSSGSRVVMLHGLLLGNVATWYFTAAPVLAERHRVLLYDLRGHGRSEVPASGYDLTTMAADLEALLDDGPVDLIGHSYGGLVALRFALDHPGRVRRLVLVDTPLPPTAPAEIAAFLDRPADEMVAALPPELQAAVAGGRRQARKLIEHLVRLATQTTLLADLQATSPFDDAELATLTAQLHLIYGTDSAVAGSGAHLHTVVPGARLVSLPGGHYLHLDDPAALTAALVEAIDG